MADTCAGYDTIPPQDALTALRRLVKEPRWNNRSDLDDEQDPSSDSQSPDSSRSLIWDLGR